MKKLRLWILLILLLLPPSIHAISQEGDAAPRQPTLEITGINPIDLPTILITANIFDPLLQPTRGLTAEDFTLSGDLEGLAEIVSVENVTDDNLPIAAVLMIDTSSSMAGRPLDEAKEAARNFVNALGPDDQVAVMTFNSTVQLVQDYTSDKEQLITAIDALGFGGRTALYEAAVRAIEKAAEAPYPRRTAILLSDGAEFGGVSRALRATALEDASVRGVSVYTIGLGFGIDRSYLIELASGTNARNYESPTPEELPEIYAELAGLLRSQYVITVNADIPGDGREYTVALQADTPQGMTNVATATFRAPIPVPLLTAPNFDDAPIMEVTEVMIEVLADDELVASETTITSPTGEIVDQIVTDGAANNTFTVNPAILEPGVYTVTHTVRDEDGDEGSVTFDMEIGALPSQITLEPDLTGLTLDAPVSVTIDASGQTEVAEGAVTIAGETIPFDSTPFTFDLDPFTLPPGDQILTVSVTNEGGATSTADVAFIVAAFPPIINIEGIEEGMVFSGSFLPGDSATIFVNVQETQTPITEVRVLVDGEDVSGPLTEPPFDVTLPDFLTLGSGPHTLTVIVSNEGGGTTEATLNFTVDVIATPTVDVQGTADADATITATAQAGLAIIASQTADAFATLNIESTATAEAEETVGAVAQATQDHEATIDARATATGLVQQNTTETAEAGATATGVAEEMLTATTEADETATEMAAEDVTATAESEQRATEIAQENATATAESNETATSAAEGTLTETAEADETATEIAQEEATTTADAMTEAAATEAEATRERQASIAQATTEAQEQMTQTAEAALEATANAQASETAQAELEATLTEAAEITQTAEAEIEATVNAQATQTADAETEGTLTAVAEITQTADAEIEATLTVAARTTQTASAEENTTATADAETTRIAQISTEVIEEATPTDTLTATPTEEEVEEPTATLDIEVTDPTPVGELTEVDETGAEIDDTPWVPIVAIGVLVLLILMLLLGRRGRER